MKPNPTNTIFKVNGENIEVEGVGQDTCSAVIKNYPRFTHIVLVGFKNTSTGAFIPAILESSGKKLS